MTQGTITNIIIAIIVFGAIATAIGASITTWGTTYDITVETEFKDTYNKLNETNELSAELKDIIQEDDFVSTIGAIPRAAYTTLQLILKTPYNIISNVATNLADDVGVPPVFVGMFLSVVLITIVMVIVSAYLRNPV